MVELIKRAPARGQLWHIWGETLQNPSSRTECNPQGTTLFNLAHWATKKAASVHNKALLFFTFSAYQRFTANCSVFNVTCFHFVFFFIAPLHSGRSSILCHHVSKHTNKTAINVILNLGITRYLTPSLRDTFISRRAVTSLLSPRLRLVLHWTGDQYSQRNTMIQSTFNLI